MVLVFILCAIIIIVILFITMLILSTIRIEMRHFQASNIQGHRDEIMELHDLEKNKNKQHSSSPVSKDYEFNISLVLFDKLKWLWVHLNDKKINKISSKIKWKKIDFKKMEQDFKLEDIKQIKKLQLNLDYLYLESKIGVEDVIITSFLVGIISTFISCILPHITKEYKENKYHYKIVPLYLNKNLYEIKFDCIIKIKMVHIINILYYFLKKRRGENYEQRASDRRSYGYSYE